MPDECLLFKDVYTSPIFKSFIHLCANNSLYHIRSHYFVTPIVCNYFEMMKYNYLEDKLARFSQPKLSNWLQNHTNLTRHSSCMKYYTYVKTGNVHAFWRLHTNVWFPTKVMSLSSDTCNHGAYYLQITRLCVDILNNDIK